MPDSFVRAFEILESRTLFSLSFYTIVDLGTLSGGTTSDANAINNEGQIVGVADTKAGIDHAVIWNNHKITDLKVLQAGYSSVANAINDAGKVVGSSEDPTLGRPTQQAVAWTSGAIQSLAPLSGETSASALAISSRDEAVGESGFRPALWAADLVAPILNNTDEGIARGVNKFGLVVGSDNNMPAAFQSGQTIQLGGIAGQTGKLGDANAINDRGDIVGLVDTSTDSTPLYHAFLYSGGIMTDIGSLGGGSKAEAINASQTVVGTSFFSAGTKQHAFAWSKPNGFIDLNLLTPLHSGWTIIDAHGINNAGQIVGEAINAAGQTHAVLLNPGAGPRRDTKPPTARLAATPDLTTAQTSYTITVTYSDDTAINYRTLRGANILVKDANGFRRTAALLKISAKSNGPHRTVTYKIVGPSGNWTGAANGTYSVYLQTHQVADTANNFALPVLLGSFNVNIAT